MKFLIIVFVLLSHLSYSQIIPSFQGVHSHKTTSESMSNTALDFDNQDYFTTNGNAISNTWTVEVWYKKASNGSARNLTNRTNGNSGGTWGLRLGTYNNVQKVGIVKYNDKDYYIDNASANLGIDEWEHIAWTYQTNTLTIYVNGVSLGNTYKAHNKGSSTYSSLAATPLYWNYIGKSRNSNSITGMIDELRIWNDVRTEEEINNKMFSDLDGDEEGLVAYYNMTDGSGSTVSNNSQNTIDGISPSTYNGTMVGMDNSDWVTSYVPIGNLSSSYSTDIEAIWKKTSTNSSEASSGISIEVDVALSEENFAVFGNNNTSSTSTSGLPSGTAVRSARIWQVDKYGTVSADINFNLSEVIGANPSSVGGSSNYKLLYRVGTSGGFLVEATASAVTSVGDNIVTFSDVTLKDGYYAIAATQSGNL